MRRVAPVVILCLLFILPGFAQAQTCPQPVVMLVGGSNPACAGQPVTLSWSVSSSTYNIIAPQVGPVRGTSVVIVPTATTTYTLNATNQFDRSTATVTVTVH